MSKLAEGFAASMFPRWRKCLPRIGELSVETSVLQCETSEQLVTNMTIMCD
jgi:hypothetical protein